MNSCIQLMKASVAETSDHSLHDLSAAYILPKIVSLIYIKERSNEPLRH